MNVLIVGGRGFVGSALTGFLKDRGHEVYISTRRQTEEGGYITWNTVDPIPADRLAGIDAVVNLAGASIFEGRWTAARKEELRASRIGTTRLLVESLRQADPRPRLLVSASAIGYYGDRGDEEVDEESSPGDDFLATLCRDWEAEAMEARKSGVRVVITRFGLILGEGGGALGQMLPAFKKYVGGYIGSGRQWMSWVHIDDVCGFIAYALENESVTGRFNLTAPNPVRNREFAKILGGVLHRPSIFPLPRIVLKLALGEFADVLVTGQKVMPKRTLEAGYDFRHPDLEVALKDILNNSSWNKEG